jgi:VIT1/CCC1 family predicted Fe2+/Mn2+ transporter
MVKNDWQFNKEISLGDIVAFSSALIAVLYSYTTLERRIALMEAVQVRQIVIDNRQDTDMSQINQSVQRELEKINIKLDRMNGYK